MDSEFPEWYQEVDLAPTGETLTKRWEGVEKFTAGLKLAGVADVARVLYGLPPKETDFLTRLRGAFQTSDPAFVVRGNDREIQVLAGAVLVHAMETVRLGDMAALAARCGDAQELRRGTTPSFAVTKANRYLRERCADLRRRELITASSVPASFKTDTAALRQESPPDAPTQHKALKALTEAVEAVINSSDLMIRAHRLRREEADILWWAFSGFSRDLDQPFQQLPPGVRALVAAKELVDLIQVMPGPVSANALLDRVIYGEGGAGREATVTLQQAVEPVPKTWLREWTGGRTAIDQYSDLCPTLMASQRVAEGAGAGWAASVEGVTRVSVTAPLTPLRLAAQAYDEHRLLKVLPQK